jgi:hypothetical protein
LLLFLQKKKTLPSYKPSRSRQQPARGIDEPHMVVRIPERALNHRQPLKIVASAIFHRNADTTMHLDRGLAEKMR